MVLNNHRQQNIKNNNFSDVTETKKQIIKKKKKINK